MRTIGSDPPAPPALMRHTIADSDAQLVPCHARIHKGVAKSQGIWLNPHRPG